MTAIGAGEWLSKKEKEFMDMDNSVVIAGGRELQEDWIVVGENTIKIKSKNI